MKQVYVISAFCMEYAWLNIVRHSCDCVNLLRCISYFESVIILTHISRTHVAFVIIILHHTEYTTARSTAWCLHGVTVLLLHAWCA